MTKKTFTPSFRGGTGEPLVLIHGFTSFWETWEPMLPALTAQFDVFAPTLLGHAGRPAVPDGVNLISALADDLEAQLDAAGMSTAHLVGNSLGGWLSMELMRRVRALSVVALSPAGGWRTNSDTKRTARLFAYTFRMVRFARPLARLFMRLGLMRRLGMRPFALRANQLTMPEMVDAMDGMLSVDVERFTVLTDDRLEPFPDPGVPALIAWSEHDRTIPAPRYSDLWREVAPFAEFRVLPNVGHVPMIDNPALVSATIIDWAGRPAITDKSA
jgi:pimeloyl-ACP methyl ester carboxylesterase